MRSFCATLVLALIASASANAMASDTTLNLIHPASGASLKNGPPQKWRFEWSNVADATEYELFVIHPEGNIPTVFVDGIVETNYLHVENKFVDQERLKGWLGRVRAIPPSFEPDFEYYKSVLAKNDIVARPNQSTHMSKKSAMHTWRTSDEAVRQITPPEALEFVSIAFNQTAGKSPSISTPTEPSIDSKKIFMLKSDQAKSSISQSGGTLIQTGAADDQFEGAVWKFKITPKNIEPLVGRYRINDHSLYQREVLRGSDYSKKVGTNFPKGQKTMTVFTDMRGFTQNTRRVIEGLRGTAHLELQEYGHWTGTIKLDGKPEMKMECIRILE